MQRNQANKARVRAYWQALDQADADQLPGVVAEYLPQSFNCKGPAPLERLPDRAALLEQLLLPLKKALPTLQRETHLFLGGQSVDHGSEAAKDAFWVAGTGYFCGVATNSFLGIPATDKPLRIRWSEFIRFDGDAMVESQILLDFVDWFDQIGLSVLPAPRGAAHVFPAPTGFVGTLFDEQDWQKTNATLELGKQFIYGGLNAFDSNNLKSMGMADYFHPNLKWYGPGGIGACLSFKEFETLHQQPWLLAFPDRKVMGLESLFAEGEVLAASGVAGVCATHTGAYLGHAASGARLEVSGIDFWLRSGDQFTENWVFVDMVKLFSQMGVDLFSEMATVRDRHGLVA